jgi:hypothetical protein
MRARMRTQGIVLALFIAACGKGGSSRPAPAKPPTGAPVAVEATVSGKDAVEVDVYDFSDKSVAAYDLMFRYHDKDGKVLKVQPGTPFEGVIDRMSVSGREYMCAPGQWAHFKVDMLHVPDGAVKVDALVDRVRSTDGTKIDDLWKLPPSASMDEWPAK